ncbi:BRO-N domain-containing protein [Weissella cibaria]|uniref:BRO-N domain-containing protein n=1 Tax=Weissella cibaria TaxID=137591 RepID=UPI0015F4CC2E|nr:BRO family protein [Weissella cibaria]QMU89421.1 hypothetical protein H3N00_05200 [Weissella cibaria]
MTNEVQVFNFEQMNVRTVEINDEVWFVAADVANALGLSNVSMSIKALDDDERSKFNLGRQGEVNVINEPGLYNFIGSSRKTEAKQFMRWVRHEVLPSIRKTGSYQAKPMTPMEGNNVNTLEWFLDSPARGRSYPESLIKKNKRGPGNHRPDLVYFL